MTLRRVRMGDEMPRFSGVAWHEINRMEAVVLPVPLNLLAGWLRRHWLDMRFGVRPAAIERIVDQAHAAGRSSGLSLRRYHLAKEYQRGLDEGTLRGIRQAIAGLGAVSAFDDRHRRHQEATRSSTQ